MTTTRTLRILVNQDGNATAGLSSLKSGLASVASVAAIGLAALSSIGVGAGLAGAKLISLGSDAEEMQGKFNIVFSEEGDRVTKSLDDFGNAVGRNKFELMGYAAALQDTFVPLGFARTAAADMSTQLTKLAVDLGSFNNVADGEVLNDLQTAVVGNTEVMRKYGVVINQSAIEQEALNLGLLKGSVDTEKLTAGQNNLTIQQQKLNELRSKGTASASQMMAAEERVRKAEEKLSDALAGTTGELDAQAKAQAILSLIMKGTTDAQGDAERTSGSWANQMRKLKATITEAATEMGVKLLPVVTPFLAKAGDLANRVLPMLVDWFSAQLVPALQSTINLFTMLVTGDFTGGIFGLPEDSGLITFLLDARRTVMELWNAFQAGGVQGVIEALGPMLAEAWNTFVLPTIMGWKNDIFAWVVESYPQVGPVLARLLVAIGTFLLTTWNTTVMPIVNRFADQIFEWAALAYANIPTYLDNLMVGITTFLTGQGPVIRENVHGWILAFWSWVSGAVDQVGVVLAGLLIAIGAWAMGDESQARMVEAGTAIGQWVADGIVFLFQNAGLIAEILTKLATGLLIGVAAIASILIVVGANVVAGILAGILNKLGGDFQPTTLNKLGEVIRGMHSNLATIARVLGGRIVEGIKSGVINGIPSLMAAAVKAAMDMLNAARRALGIGSPSKVFTDMGENTIDSFASPFKNPERARRTVGAGVRSLVGAAAATSTGGAVGAAVQIILQYQPTISTADKIEIDQKLIPLILGGLRRAGVAVGG
ncbi:MAG TPA: hypothetical protein VGD99_21840 [Anaerolineae bacterium]|jgi:hypothetical protein